VDYAGFIKAAEQGRLSPVTLLHSEEPFLLDDAVARASWPIELWEEGRLGATYEFLPDGTYYDIPLRCLQARDVDNLFVAGRCMSATHEALGSARVIGTCLATGEAVGRAAARYAEAR